MVPSIPKRRPNKPIPLLLDWDKFPRHRVADPITMSEGLEWDEHDLENCTIVTVASGHVDEENWPIFEHWRVDQKLIQHPLSRYKDWRGFR